MVNDIKQRFRIWVEQLGLWLIHIAGSEVIILPVSMLPYMDELHDLCVMEDDRKYGSTDMHGDGYFKTRLVLIEMLKRYPELKEHRRDLMKGIIVTVDRLRTEK